MNLAVVAVVVVVGDKQVEDMLVLVEEDRWVGIVGNHKWVELVLQKIEMDHADLSLVDKCPWEEVLLLYREEKFVCLEMTVKSSVRKNQREMVGKQEEER
jgi:hypothetical protein